MKLINSICFFVLLFFSSIAKGDVLDVNLNKKVITEGDTVLLTIEYKGDKNEEPDLSGLQGDFQVVSNSRSSQINYINGVISSSKKWTIGLKPLKKGKIAIKPIKLGNLTSNYEEIEVKELSDVAYVPDSKTNFNAPYFQLEQSFDKNNVYLHEQMLLNLTLYDSLGLRDGVINLSPSSKDDWVVIPLSSKPIKREDTINGKRMFLSTLVYAIFPQKSGEIKAPEFVFDGYYLKHSQSSFTDFGEDFMMFGVDFRGAFGEKVPVRMKSKSKIINVKPNIESVSLKNWLPLVNLNAKASLSQNKDFKVGDAFNYVLEIKAYGISKDLFPDIVFPNSDGLKMYPEKPEFSEEFIDGSVVTTATYNIVYIPTKSGDISISPINISWFNLNTKKEETYKINGVDIFVNSNGIAKVDDFEDTITSDNIEEPNNELIEKKEEAIKEKLDIMQYLNKIIIAITSLIILFALIFILKKGKKKTTSSYSKNVIDAIYKHDLALAKACILDWAKNKYRDDNIKNFMMVSEYVKNKDFEKQLDILNKLLYSNSDVGFNSHEFVKLFKEIDKKQVIKNKKQEILPNLYK